MDLSIAFPTPFLGPLRANVSVLAKQAQSVHALSGERLTLGIGLGNREDDFEFAGLPLGNRGDELEQMLGKLKADWADERMGPATATPPTLIAGGLPPEVFAEAAEKVSLGDGGEEYAKNYLTDYYAWLGEETANFIAGSAAKDAETVKGYLAAFEGVGCDELILFPSNPDPAQVDLLADAAGL